MTISKTSAVTAALVTIALSPAVPAAAQVVGGSLTKQEAHDFEQRQLPESAPKLLLKDERGDFYSTSKTHIEQAEHCGRVSKAMVNCRFRVRLKPDKAHAAKNWWPIRCRGSFDIARLTNGGIGGELQNYVCKTIVQKA